MSITIGEDELSDEMREPFPSRHDAVAAIKEFKSRLLALREELHIKEFLVIVRVPYLHNGETVHATQGGGSTNYPTDLACRLLDACCEVPED